MLAYKVSADFLVDLRDYTSQYQGTTEKNSESEKLKHFLYWHVDVKGANLKAKLEAERKSDYF